MNALIAYRLALALALTPAAAEVVLAVEERKTSNPAAEVATTELPKMCRQLRGCHNMFCRCLGQQLLPNQVEGPEHQGQVLLQWTLARAPQRHVGMDTSMVLPHSAADQARTAAEHNNEHGTQPLAGLGCCCRGRHREAVGSACWKRSGAWHANLNHGVSQKEVQIYPPTAFNNKLAKTLLRTFGF